MKIKIGTLVRVTNDRLSGFNKIGIVLEKVGLGRYTVSFLNKKYYDSYYYNDELLILNEGPINNWLNFFCSWCNAECKTAHIKNSIYQYHYCPKCLR